MNHADVGLLEIGHHADPEAGGQADPQGDLIEASCARNQVHVLLLQLIDLFVANVDGDANWNCNKVGGELN